jgi:hypothetical protein
MKFRLHDVSFAISISLDETYRIWYYVKSVYSRTLELSMMSDLKKKRTFDDDSNRIIL